MKLFIWGLCGALWIGAVYVLAMGWVFDAAMFITLGV